MAEPGKAWVMVPAIASAAAALLSGLSAWQGNQNKQEIERLNSKLTQTVEERRFAQVIMDRFDQVITAEKGDVQTRIDRLAGLTTLAAMIGDERAPVRTAILDTIYDQARRYQATAKDRREGATPAALRVIDRQVLDLERIKQATLAAKAAASVATATGVEPSSAGKSAEASPAAASPVAAAAAGAGWGTLRIDIFYCEGDSAATARQQTAARLASLRDLDAAATGAWRVRALSAETNARPGYGVDRNVIRVSDRSEQRAAERLQTAVRDVTGVNFAIEPVTFKSPNYISAFICEGGTAA